MRILFLTHYFPPEVNAPATRTHEHCREWVAAGHEVHVVTCMPSHPAGEPFPGYRRQWYRRESVDGIHVHRVWTYLTGNRGVVRRTLNYLSFAVAGSWRAWRLGTFDVAIGTSPQFFCAAATWLVAKLRRMPWVFELRDLWPESIAALGVLERQSLPLRWLERVELRLYRDAAAVACLTRSFVTALESRGVDRAKLHYMPNGIIPEFWSTGDADHRRRELKLGPNDVLISYVGTTGMAHDLRTVLMAAAQLQSRAPEVRFLIVGDGAELDLLRANAAGRRLTNLRFTGLVPRARIPSLLAASDVMLVTLRPSEVFRTVLPSKMFEAMAACRPIVLAVDGEARTTLLEADAGVAIPPADPTALADAIWALARDPARRAEMGAAGAAFARREFDRRIWATRYLALLETVAVAAMSPHRVAVDGDDAVTM
jgi:glycosyltransferase involved in cell wall biosynthesis